MFMVVAEVINLSLDWKFSNEVMNTSEPLNDNIKQFSWWLSSWELCAVPDTAGFLVRTV